MKHPPSLTAALAAVLVLSAPTGQAGAGIDSRALDGRRIAPPDGSQIVGEPARKLESITSSGPALDGWQAATPDLAGLWMDFKRFPGDAWEIRPIDPAMAERGSELAGAAIACGNCGTGRSRSRPFRWPPRADPVHPQ